MTTAQDTDGDDRPRTDGRPPAEVVSAMVDHVLDLVSTWPRWDGRPFQVPVEGEAPREHTPHKAVRRVADHLLDHLAEVEARVAGRPTEPDRWHGSSVTTAADLARFTAEDVDEARSRLRRLAQLWALRLRTLSDEQLDAAVADGWTLREVAFHVAGSAFYADSVGRLGQREAGHADVRRTAAVDVLGVDADPDGVIVVRPAGPPDLEALVELRRENGRVHRSLDPTVYRVPDPGDVREHFATVLAGVVEDVRTVVLVAVEGEDVLGMAEVALDPEPPAHQVLEPLPSAHVHLVVAERARRLGVGDALAEAAQAWAVERGVRQLVAGVQSDNAPALRFYGSHGYRDNAAVLVKDVPEPSA